MDSPPLLNLRWRQHCLELTTLLEDIRVKGLYSDAIISCEDQHYPVHSALLSISSDFFEKIFKGRCCEKPLIVIKDVSTIHLEKLLIYIYSGEVSIHQDEISKFIELAESLQIKGTNFKNMDICAISAMKINNTEYRIIENNQMVEQLKITNKKSDTSKFLEPNSKRENECTQSILKENISTNHNNLSSENITKIQNVIREDNIENNNSNCTKSSREVLLPRCSTTPSLPMDLTLNIMTSSSSILPHPVSQSSSSLSLPSSSSSSTSLSKVFPSSVSASVSSEKASLTSATSVVNVVTGGVTAPVTLCAPHTMIRPFEALIKDEPIHGEDLPESEKIDEKILTQACTETKYKSEEHDGNLVNNKKKILKSIPPMIPFTTRSEVTLQMQNNFSNKMATKYMPDISKFTNEEHNHGVITSPSSSISTSPIPSRPPRPHPPPVLSRTSGPRPPPALFRPSAPRPSPSLLPKSGMIQPTSRPQLPALIPSPDVNSRLSLNTSPYTRPRPPLDADSRCTLNSSALSISSGNKCRDNDTPDENQANNSSDKTWYKVYPNGENDNPEEDCTVKPSEKAWCRSDETLYKLYTQDEAGIGCNQPPNKSTFNIKDLDPRTKFNINDQTSEANPVIVRNTPLANRNPRLLVNPLPVGPSRYNSKLIGSNKNSSTHIPPSLTPPDRISISSSDVSESPKVSIHTVSSGTTQMSSVYRAPFTSTTSQLGVRKDLIHQPKLNLKNKDSPLESSQEMSNVSTIFPVQPVSFPPKDTISQYQNEGDSDFTHEDGNSLPDVPINKDFNFDSSCSKKHPSSNNDNYFSLPSTSKNHIDKNTIGNSKNSNESVNSQRFPTTLHRRRFRGPKAWEFLARLLKDPSTYGSLIRWEDEEQMVFRLVDPNEIARRWGSRQVNNAKAKNYHNFARSLRYHYSTGALAPVSERQLVYKFGPNAVKVLSEYDNIFKNTGGLPRISSQNTYSDLVRIEREHYDTNPEFSGKTASHKSHSVANPPLQSQAQKETTPLRPADLTSGINVSQSNIGSLNYGITYRTPSGNILPVPNFKGVPFPKASSAHAVTSSGMNAQYNPVTITSRNINIGKVIYTSSTQMSTRTLPSFSKIKSPETNINFSNVPALKPISAIRFPNESTKMNETSKIFGRNEFEEHASPIMGKGSVCNESSLAEKTIEQKSNKQLFSKSDLEKELNNEDRNIFKMLQHNPKFSNNLQTSSIPNNVLDPNESTSDHVKKLVVSTTVTESISMPIFIPKLKSFPNGSSIPTSQSIANKDVNNSETNINSTTAPIDKPEQNYDDSYSKNEAKSISIGQKHKLEENEMPIDFKRRWKNDNLK